MFLGSIPLFFNASLIAARSATAGTPVKSCIRTRVGVNDISKFSSGVAIFLHKLSIISLVTASPSSFLRRFSIIIFIEFGILLNSKL